MSDKYINGEDGVYYNYVQAATMIGESDTTLRWWVQELDSVLDMHTTEKGTKRFRREDIENFIYIRKLIREDGYTLSQVRAYCSERALEENELIDSYDKLQAKSFMDVLTNEIELKINDMKEDLLNQQREMLLKLLDGQMQLNDELVSKISESTELRNNEVIKRLDTNHNNLSEYFENIEDKISNIEKKQDEAIKTAYLSLDQVKAQMNARKPWYERLIDKLK